MAYLLGDWATDGQPSDKLKLLGNRVTQWVWPFSEVPDFTPLSTEKSSHSLHFLEPQKVVHLAYTSRCMPILKASITARDMLIAIILDNYIKNCQSEDIDSYII